MRADIGIHFNIAIFVWLVSWTAAIEIPRDYLENPSKICSPHSSCEHVRPEWPLAAQIGNGPNHTEWRNCMCDDYCKTYGDCCTDSPFFDPVKQQRAAAQYVCVVIDSTEDGKGAQTLAKCPAAWSDQRVRNACETPPRAGIDYGMLDNPVISQQTGRVYRNRFCAVCNGDAADTVLGNTKLVCHDLIEEFPDTVQKVLDTLRYDNISNRWTVLQDNVTYNCVTKTVLPAISKIRPCIPGTVSTCSPDWPNNDTRSDCETYTVVVYDHTQTYKNPHCAMCNQMSVQNMKCMGGVDLKSIPDLYSFTALFVIKPDSNKCGSSMFYDPFIKSCQLLAPIGDDVPLNCSNIAMYVAEPPNLQSINTFEYVMLNNGTVKCA